MDCLEGMKQIDDKSIDMVLTDIPYGEINEIFKEGQKGFSGTRKLYKFDADKQTFYLKDFLQNTYRVLKSNGSIYIFCGIMQISEITSSLRQNNFSTRLCVLEKNNPSPINGNKLWLSGIECCVFGRLPKATFNENCKNTVWRYPRNQTESFHPTQKPLKLFQYLIETSSNENDLILDNCMGSGTTAVACIQSKRNFIGFELNKEYFDKAQERVSIAKEIKQNSVENWF